LKRSPFCRYRAAHIDTEGKQHHRTMPHHHGGIAILCVVLLFALTVSGCRNGTRRTTPVADEEVIRQQRRNTCGPAALAMLLTSMGRRTTEAELEQAMRLTADGATLTSLLTTAASHGVRLEAWRLHQDTLGSIRPPAILWVDGDHFVVFDSLARDTAFLRDPSEGRVSVPFEHLKKRWNGTAALVAGPP
jgi:predicted double-glycine peptidase